MNSSSLKTAFREYLAVHDGIALGGHELDAMAGDLTRIVEAMASRARCNASGQQCEDAAQFRTAAPTAAKEGGAA